MGLLTGSGIAIRDARISSTSQLSLLPPAMRFQCNVSISIKPSPQFHSHLQLQLSTNQKLMVVSALGDGGIDGETQRNSPLEVEIQRCYQFVHRLGRGVWDLRSSQVKPTHPHYLLALELSREACFSLFSPFICSFLSGFVSQKYIFSSVKKLWACSNCHVQFDVHLLYW
jgi:hypothetical protein